MQRSHRKLLNAALCSNIILSCALLLTTMFLLETPYVGLDATITASVYVVFNFVSIVILNKAPSAFCVGFVVGASLLVLVLAVQSALYWGEAHSNSRYQSAGYLASGIHSMIFLVQCGVTTVVVKSKEAVIDTYAAYEYIPDNVLSTNRSGPTCLMNYNTATSTVNIDRLNFGRIGNT
ncbi:uncharacterized protein PHALS_02766 [Plasmopara halstedii]|uniref:Transmembrane protein n=1 Tax=Plasmopara halstedii TaxID=4781 RepID=A0A0N7L784_PLAHL|nr:uncharacterized protein PHALS_02766 [Plasmopara halstedii]CEG46363.1 hypothetical protein PHALS_02766 [Plasmopara halstedii]|eukprot:XP_024582732.1 hypothetical protein PHALS_02766 [Plasmopara halstedii]